MNVSQEGQVFVDGRMLSEGELEAALRQAVVNNPTSQKVIIRADKRVVFDRVVAVMNLCNRTGVQSYSVTTANDGG